MKRLVAGVFVLALSLAGRAGVSPTFIDITPPREIYNPGVLTVAIHPLDGRRLIVTTSNQVRVTLDGGATWRTTAALPGFPERLFAHRGRPGVVFLQGATSEVLIGAQRHRGYTLVSKDFGETWSVLADGRRGDTELVMAPFASVPSQPERLFATQRRTNFTISTSLALPLSPEISVVESRDGGASWSATATFPSIARGGIRSFEGPTPATPERIFVTTEDDGSYISINGGQAWSQFPERHMGRFFWFRQDPANASVIYASAELAGGSGRAIVRSMDSGESWQAIYPIEYEAALSLFNPGYGELAIDPVRPSRLWLTSVKAGVVLSEDRGASWQPAAFVPETPQCGAVPCVTPIWWNRIVERVLVSPANDSQAYFIRNGSLYRAVLPPRNRVAVEYQYGDRFWITGDSAEALSQDYRANEAVRTGRPFGFWSAADAPTGAKAVCRFQGNPTRGQTSRFLTLQGSECDTLRQDAGLGARGRGTNPSRCRPGRAANARPSTSPSHAS
jgi:hypothetical protein